MANASVERFKTALRQLPTAMRDNVRPVLMQQANMLAAAQRAAIQHQESGHLAESVRVEASADDMQVFVRAGGPLTTKGGYDYALAEEFGTTKEGARPFFYSTFRAKRRQILSAIAKAAVLPTRSATRTG